MSSLQDTYAPNNECFGCGPANKQGLQIKSFVEGDEVVATWQPAPYHHAFANILNGGIIGALLDCHSNWTAAHALMKASGAKEPPCTVTADFHVKLKRPTPMDAGPVKLRAKVTQLEGDRARHRSDARSGRQSDRDVHRDFRRRQRRTPRVPQVVGRPNATMRRDKANTAPRSDNGAMCLRNPASPRYVAARFPPKPNPVPIV